MDEKICELLKENLRRNEAISRPYDPIAGDPDDPDRVWFPVKGLECRIPKTMERELFVRELLHFESLEKYLAVTKKCVSQELTDAVIRKWTLLRCRHDFPFWAATFAYIKKKGGGDDVLFVLNRPQRKLVDALEKMRRNGDPIGLYS